jgi:hypothetical protein
MYRSVLANKDFIRWSREHVVALVAHNELGHEELKETDSYGKEVRRCTLYPGLACREHLDIAVEIDTARGDDLVKVPFLELHPNSWIVAPTGEVTQVLETEQFTVGKIQERVEALQKTLGDPVPLKAWPALQDLATKAQQAVDDERFHDALTHLAAMGVSVKKPHTSLKTWIDTRLTEVEEDVLFLFEETRDDAKLPAAEKRAKLGALLTSVDVAVLCARIPSHAALAAWLAR